MIQSLIFLSLLALASSYRQTPRRSLLSRQSLESDVPLFNRALSKTSRNEFTPFLAQEKPQGLWDYEEDFAADEMDSVDEKIPLAFGAMAGFSLPFIVVYLAST